MCWQTRLEEIESAEEECEPNQHPHDREAREREDEFGDQEQGHGEPEIARLALAIVTNQQRHRDRKRGRERPKIDHPVTRDRQLETLAENEREADEARRQDRVQNEHVEVELQEFGLERRQKRERCLPCRLLYARQRQYERNGDQCSAGRGPEYALDSGARGDCGARYYRHHERYTEANAVDCHRARSNGLPRCVG